MRDKKKFDFEDEVTPIEDPSVGLQTICMTGVGVVQIADFAGNRIVVNAGDIPKLCMGLLADYEFLRRQADKPK